MLTDNEYTLLRFSVPKDDRIKRICEVLKPSELIDIDEETQKIRRSPDCPLPEKDAEERTIYLKGFHKTETTLDELLGTYPHSMGLGLLNTKSIILYLFHCN